MKKWIEIGLYVQGFGLMLVVYYGFFTGLVAAEAKITEIEGRVENKFLQASVDNYLSNYQTHQEYWVRLEDGRNVKLTASLYESIKPGEDIKVVRMKAGTMIFQQ
ncbi:hypothetical protein [Cytobacillus sp. NCCP-133]|uniref:hypothetical protein n=1 Tax=Cytobacillus sp. NCCP-133 TaxID=766848 RepID=UPI0022311068|nr:hypothetical protein [Cytobacillus sp. NCCP-133]GLB60660.1 hypothetical protein NCCP133_27920 [Cytobacillus sp. NCCP-133]